MTTIAGRVYNNKIVIGADSAVSSGWTRIDSGVKHTKVFKGNDCVIACAGLASDAALVHLYSVDHSIGNISEIRVVEWLAEFLSWKQNYSDERTLNLHCLIAHAGGLYSTSGLSAMQVSDFYADGSGRDFALACLYSGKTVQESLNTAVELDCFSGNPVVIHEVKRSRSKKK